MMNSRRTIAIVIFTLVFAAAVQLIPHTAAAGLDQDVFTNSLLKVGNEEKGGKPSTSAGLTTVYVGSVTTIWWYRRSPVAPGTVEYCTAATNGNYGRLSASPNGPFSFSYIVNVPFYSDGSGEMGFGRTPDLYLKAVAPVQNLQITLTCPSTVNDVAYVTIEAAPTPTPTPTPVPSPEILIQKTGTNVIGVGERSRFFVEIRNGIPGQSSTLTIGGSAKWGPNGTLVPFRFGVSAAGGDPPQASLSVPFTLDATGAYRSSAIYITGLEAHQFNDSLSAQYHDGVKWISGVIPVYIHNVASIWFERDAGQVPIDDNPWIGGGKRVFPEKKTPTDTSPGRNRATVKAKINKAKSGVQVKFRLIDVDDPELAYWETDPLTGFPYDPYGNTDVDPNGIAGNDNRGPSSLRVSSGLATTDSTGTASMEVNLPQQPGDNIRVIASVIGDTISSHNVAFSSTNTAPREIVIPAATVIAGIELIDGWGNILAPTADLTRPVAASEMLTTWRRLHLEVDSMGIVSGNFKTGSIVAVTPQTAFTTKITTNLTMKKNLYDEGRIDFKIGAVNHSYPIVTSSINTVTVKGVVPSTAVGAAIKLYDDDDMNGNDAANKHGDNGEDVPIPKLDWLQDSSNMSDNLLTPVFIVPTYDLTGTQSDLDFYAHIPIANPADTEPSTTDYLSVTKFNNVPTLDDREFWTVYMLGAYQEMVNKDLDPDAENSNALALGSSVFGIMVFNEIVSDSTWHVFEEVEDIWYFYDSWKDTPVHEVGHTLNAAHEDGGRMNDEYPYWSGKSMNAMRNTLAPMANY